MKHFYALLICSFLLSAFTVNAEEQKITPSEIVDYKKLDNDSLKLHFFYPDGFKKNDGSKKPAIVFFFGGGWSGGTPAQFYPFCDHLAKKGIVAISAQYRTSGSHKTTPKECVKDGKSAIRWVREHAAEFNIDPDKIAAGGGSAGGHVAATTATLKEYDEPSENLKISSKPNLLVLFNPVIDNSEKGYGHSRVKDYWQTFSPLHNIPKDIPPSIFFLGSKDILIPVATGEAWDKEVKAQGQVSELHIYEGKEHGFFNINKENGANFQKILPTMDAFLKKFGYISP